MQRVFFFENNGYKRTTPHKFDPDYIPLAIKNDAKSQKNGTKKTVFWVKKRPNDEDGKVKGETWTTSQQYIGDWKNNKKEGYGIKIYDNKDKYEGNWKNGLRHGKGTYWVCIGKNKFRKLYTGDWFENKKEGQGIYFYNDGSCYDGIWKNSKRDGKGLMIYSNGDIYEGLWLNDLKHGYGILERKTGDKYYGHWNVGLKEGQGYYYYSETGKIYLGEWHEDVPRCGIFTDVDDESIKKVYSKHFRVEDAPPLIPELRLNLAEDILEDSINNVHFLRNIKSAKTKTLQELFPHEIHQDIAIIFNQKSSKPEEDKEISVSSNVISLQDFKEICAEKLGQNVNDETLELIFYVFEIPFSEDTRVDFLLFSRLFYLIYAKKVEEDKNMSADEDGELNPEVSYMEQEEDDVKKMTNELWRDNDEVEERENEYEEYEQDSNYNNQEEDEQD